MADGKGDGEVSREAVLAALSQIEDPDLGRDIVSLGFVKDEEISISGGNVSVRIVLTTPACPGRAEMKAQAGGSLRGWARGSGRPPGCPAWRRAGSGWRRSFSSTKRGWPWSGGGR